MKRNDCIRMLIAAMTTTLFAGMCLGEEAAIDTTLVGVGGREHSDIDKQIERVGYKVTTSNNIFLYPTPRKFVGVSIKIVSKDKRYMMILSESSILPAASDPGEVPEAMLTIKQVIPATWASKAKLFLNSEQSLDASLKSVVTENCTADGQYDRNLAVIAVKSTTNKHAFDPIIAWRIDPIKLAAQEIPVVGISCICKSLSCTIQ